MSRELFWLTLTTMLTGLMWTPYIIDRIMVRGLMGAMDNPSPNAKPHSPWARRQMHAHDNAVENLVIFATLVLIANALHISNNATAIACAVYFWARLAHYIIYTMGVPGAAHADFRRGVCRAARAGARDLPAGVSS
jgi:uncharacterized MAPEG superfamily protein